MNKLLSSNLARLRKYWIFWLILAVVLIVSILTIQNYSLGAADIVKMGFIRTLDDYFFSMAPYMGAVFGAFISLFLSAEFADGTVRNKLIIGHTRSSIYLANYLVCLGACLAFVAMWFLGSLPGLLWIGPFSMGIGEFFGYLLVAIGFTASFAALFTFVCLLSNNKALTVVFCLALWVGLVVFAGAFYDRLNEPELIGGMLYDNGTLKQVDPEPNPLYLSGTARMICTGVLELLPTGQAQLMRGAEILSPARLIVFSILFTAIILWAGIQVFQKKDMK